MTPIRWGSSDPVSRDRAHLGLTAPETVSATRAALEVIKDLEAAHGPLAFFQSGGCCAGTAPICLRAEELPPGSGDRLLGTVAGAPFYMSPSQYEYWKHTQLIIDVVEGRGGMFSLENGEGVRFLTRSRLFTDDEIGQLQQAGRF